MEDGTAKWQRRSSEPQRFVRKNVPRAEVSVLAQTSSTCRSQRLMTCWWELDRNEFFFPSWSHCRKLVYFHCWFVRSVWLLLPAVHRDAGGGNAQRPKTSGTTDLSWDLQAAPEEEPGQRVSLLTNVHLSVQFSSDWCQKASPTPEKTRKHFTKVVTLTSCLWQCTLENCRCPVIARDGSDGSELLCRASFKHHLCTGCNAHTQSLQFNGSSRLEHICPVNTLLNFAFLKTFLRGILSFLITDINRRYSGGCDYSCHYAQCDPHYGLCWWDLGANLPLWFLQLSSVLCHLPDLLRGQRRERVHHLSAESPRTHVMERSVNTHSSVCLCSHFWNPQACQILAKSMPRAQEAIIC